MKQLKFILLLFVLLTLTACPISYDHGFRFENNSTHDVCIYLSIPDKIQGSTLYPDTAISEVRNGISFKQGESRHYTYSRVKEDEWVGTLCLFIFDADTFNMYEWKKIKNEYKILQRYDISHEDIKSLKYKISYPPDERMKDVKMYPPYEQK